MDSLDGLLLVPPDRGQILGRAMWKVGKTILGSVYIGGIN
jgi:hypothetical protein